jgi:hypothetical protein
MNRRTGIHVILIIAVLVLILSLISLDFENIKGSNFLTPASMVCVIIAMVLTLRSLKSQSGSNNPS